VNFFPTSSGGLDDGGESGLLGDFSPSSPLHKTTTSQSPASPPFLGMQTQPPTASAAISGSRAAPGRLEFSPEKAGKDVTPLNLDFLDRSQPAPLPFASLTGKNAKNIDKNIDYTFLFFPFV
jgi:hypothetical protein